MEGSEIIITLESSGGGLLCGIGSRDMAFAGLQERCNLRLVQSTRPISIEVIELLDHLVADALLRAGVPFPELRQPVITSNLS
jgi:hypothetical protein